MKVHSLHLLTYHDSRARSRRCAVQTCAEGRDVISEVQSLPSRMTCSFREGEVLILPD